MSFAWPCNLGVEVRESCTGECEVKCNIDGQ